MQLIQVLTGELTIMRIGRYIEHHVAVICHIGVTFGDQLLGDLNDLRNMVRRTRLQVRAQDIQRIEIFMHFGDHTID